MKAPAGLEDTPGARLQARLLGMAKAAPIVAGKPDVRPPDDFEKWNTLKQREWLRKMWPDLTENEHLTPEEKDELIRERLARI